MVANWHTLKKFQLETSAYSCEEVAYNRTNTPEKNNYKIWIK